MDALALANALRERLAARDVAGANALLDGRPVPDAAALPAAQARWSNGDYDESLRLFARAARAAPQDPEAALREVQALLMLDRRGEALERVAAARRGLADSPPLALLEAQLRLDREPATALLPAFAEIARRAPHFGEAEVALACLRLLAGEDAPAPRTFGRAMADARWASALFQRGHLPPARLLGTGPAVLAAASAAASVDGLVLEFGVFHGRSLRMLAPGRDGLVHGFDSFEGLPADWTPNDARGDLSTGGRLPAVGGHVRLHRGWFEDTLPPFLAAHDGAVRLAHVDCDLYASTVTVLEALAPRLVRGSVLVFDDFLSYPGWESHEFRAWEEFSRSRGIAHEYIAFALIGREAALVLR
jgi:hypothetical protein